MSGVSLIAKIGLDTSDFKAGLASAGKSLSNFASESVASFAGVASLAGIATLAKSLLDFGGDLQDSADALGVTTDALQELHYAFMINGTNAETFDKSFVKLTQNIQTAKGGNEAMVDSFEKLGVSWADLNSLTPEKVLLKLANGVKAADDKAASLATVMDILGKSGAKMMVGLLQGAEGLDALMKAAPKVITEDMQKLAEAGDRLDAVWTSVKVSGANVVLNLMDIHRALNDVEGTINKLEQRNLKLGDSFKVFRDMKLAVDAATEAGNAVSKAPPLLSDEGDKPSIPMSPQEIKDRRAKGEEIGEQATNFFNAQRGDEANKAELDDKAGDVKAVADDKLAAEKEALAIMREEARILNLEAHGQGTLAEIAKSKLEYETKINKAKLDGNNLLVAELEKQKTLTAEKIKQQALEDAKKAKREKDVERQLMTPTERHEAYKEARRVKRANRVVAKRDGDPDTIGKDERARRLTIRDQADRRMPLAGTVAATKDASAATLNTISTGVTGILDAIKSATNPTGPS